MEAEDYTATSLRRCEERLQNCLDDYHHLATPCIPKRGTVNCLQAAAQRHQRLTMTTPAELLSLY